MVTPDVKVSQDVRESVASRLTDQMATRGSLELLGNQDWSGFPESTGKTVYPDFQDPTGNLDTRETAGEMDIRGSKVNGASQESLATQALPGDLV